MKERQLEIIEAAGKLLSSSGVKGLTIKNLAKEMRFSESAIYRHFASKEAIIIALLNYLAVSMDERLTKAVRPEENVEEKFKMLFQSQFDFFKKHPHFAVAVFSDGLMKESEKINEAIFNLIQVKTKHLMPLIAEGQQKKVFSTVLSKAQLMHIVLGTFRLQMFNWRMEDFNFDLKKKGNTLMLSLLKLIKNK